MSRLPISEIVERDPLKTLLTVLLGTLLGALVELWVEAGGPLVSALENILSKRVLLRISLLLCLSLVLSWIVILSLRSRLNKPLAERYRFDEPCGFNIDRKGHPLCPVCLREGHVSRLTMRDKVTGYCNACKSAVKGVLH